MTQARPVGLLVEDAVAVIRIGSPPVNALSAAVRSGLLDALAAATADPAVRAVVLAAEGRTFIAGADIGEFGKPPVPPTLSDVVDAFERSAKPVVAAIDGAALGGGLELALACHGRVAGPKARLGLPEVKLGLVPGAGGTQRLPRLIGAAVALPLIAQGTTLGPADALRLGMVDEVTGDDALPAARRRALALAAPPPRSRDRDGLGSHEDFEAAATALGKQAAGNPAVQGCIDCVAAAFSKPFDEALAFERQTFRRLMEDARSKALRHVFFAERAAAQVPGLPAGTAARPVASAAVVGAGTMGGGIAMVFSNAGIPVTVIETSQEALDRGLERVRANYDTSVRRGSLSAEERDRRLARIQGQIGLDAAVEADVVVEAAFEELGLKREIFGTLDRVAKPGALLASNTSYLDIDSMAAATARPGDVLGMHFFSPANVMKLLEVVRGAQTTPEALATAVELGRRLGKQPVVVGACHGFVGNRMLARRTAQAERLLLEGAAPEEVDAALVEFGFRMGQFAMIDLAGLDIGWRVRKATGKKAPVADALCEAGRIGQKVGRGYYRYSDGARQGEPDPEVHTLIECIAGEQGIARRAIGRQEIIERLIFPMIDEGARILEEGIAARPGDIDVVWLHGYGWPAWRGGPMYHAGVLGAASVARALEGHAARSGDSTLRPSDALSRMAAA
ncbi:3-hydroxyacyl-CoA dehydrogenase NAD-binding domain-containing protein [Roseomonas haemaphysalidis]|uniref:Enoyl-CoA hydratase/isomerase family protein n=1 Tax=Roseomonas haemaphysalidis TaxID=2768162 RepID=A0ABS3KK92_9PROT|nr:3-hydroxyacyl-CoA dehydrogenase NAD-binding domain-containing protein [Roseomonas haemaphysalidis]MBO1077889.1 enoyl-CoA hydratase/isomerase family protein [Roseomonas haemaphysalidis]